MKSFVILYLKSLVIVGLIMLWIYGLYLAGEDNCGLMPWLKC